MKQSLRSWGCDETPTSDCRNPEIGVSKQYVVVIRAVSDFESFSHAEEKSLQEKKKESCSW